MIEALKHLRHELHRILAKGVEAMAAVDDLNAAVAQLASSITALDNAIQNEIAALVAANAAGNTAAVSAAAANILTASGKITADTAELVASTQAPPGGTGATGPTGTGLPPT
jgi:nicotinate-nucleotide pyrophosphorylase